ncbi:hypothetical protein EUTSA_v10029117mg [Eutrema salsugineum]|uniref:Uncharacterized protein n=2 Tax=Eutrema salsugineum TaxID=72664 RepID=V4LEZ3_EUTSA|nr:hypothetical protein EUTSA_v10029117mg [Eutrema salsugineum]
MKRLIEVMFVFFAYLMCSRAMVPYRGCDVIGAVSRSGLGKYETRVPKEDFFSGRKLVSGPSRSACGH